MHTRWTRHADAVVVGFGMTAGPVVERLMDAVGPDSHVEILDRGTLWDPKNSTYPSEAEVSLWSTLSVPPDEDHVQFVHEGRRDRLAKWWSARQAGGGALLWYGQLSRFQPSDLTMRTRFGDVAGADLRDWPLDYARLRAAYDRVERRLEPFGCSYGHTPAAYASLEGANYRERGTPSHFERVVVDGLHRAGLQAYVGQTCLGGRAWDLCPISPVDGTIRDPHRPLQSRTHWYRRLYDRLRTHPSTRLRGDAYVARVLVDRGDVQGVEYVERSPTGDLNLHRIRSSVVVLACGPLETARILLSSDLPNRNGLIGRRVTFTLERVAYLVTNVARSPDLADRLAGLHATVITKEYYEPAGDLVVRKGGKFALYDGLAAETPARHVKNLRLHGARLARFLETERERYVVKVSFKGESLPSPAKQVRLSNTRNPYGACVPAVHYTPHPVDLALQDGVTGWIDQLAKALDATEQIVHPAPRGDNLVSAHHHGGAVFGEDPTDAVLNPDCECYEARGLFIADASVMPTSGATNSSLTAMAVADLVGATVSDRL